MVSWLEVSLGRGDALGSGGKTVCGLPIPTQVSMVLSELKSLVSALGVCFAPSFGGMRTPEQQT